MIRRSIFPLIICLITLFASCKKESPNNFECEIQGVANIDARVGDTKALNLTIARTQGASENVTLSLKNVPSGISYAFETNEGNSNFATTLYISISNTVKMGIHSITVEAQSENFRKTVDFNLTIDDHISMTMKVYDESKWTTEHPVGELVIGATINLFKDSLSFANQTPYYSTITDSSGMANFYHLQPMTYIFTVEKGDLSNIVAKKEVNNKLIGFATINIDKNGQLQYRDQNGDGKISEVDRSAYDRLVVYDNVVSQRIVWIGK